MAVLVVGGRGTPKILRLDSRPVTVGRADDNRIPLRNGDVSRYHCRIEFAGDGLYRVVDLGSTNGTYLNGEPVASMALENGDRIIVGQLTLIFGNSEQDIELDAEMHEEVFPWKPAQSDEFRAIDTRVRLNKVPQQKRDDRRYENKKTAADRSTNRLKLRDILPQLTRRGQHVGSELDLANLQLTILGEILRCTAFERALLLLYDERTGLLQPVLSRNVDFDLLSPEVQHFVERLTKQAIDEQQPLFRCSTVIDPDDLTTIPRDARIECALCLPLTAPVRSIARERRQHRRQRRSLGAIFLDSSLAIESVSESEQQTLEVVAAQACTALQNAQLHYQATTDPMTRLNNRLVMWQVLRDELEWSCETSSPLGIILLDLDHFKVVNDTHGHAVGDEVLKRLARRITRVLRADDYAFRWGGEEFLILVPGAHRESVINVTNKIAHAISSAPIGEQRLYVTVSIGVALHPLHGSSPEDLLRHADIALYVAKAAGRNRTCIYDRKMNPSYSAHSAAHWTDPHTQA